MREATGNALLTMIVAATIAIILTFFVGTLSYSKSYKIKNYIIDQIEENQGWDSKLAENIDEYLKDVGYNVRDNNLNCNSELAKLKNHNNYKLPDICNTVYQTSSYNYCIYECLENVSNKYYTVLTFMKFEFPVISESLKIKVVGQTKNFYVNSSGKITPYFN